MRIKFGNKIIESDYVCNPGGQDRFVYIKTPNGQYVIDCEEPNYAKWLMDVLLTKGYFNATDVDYDNSQDDGWIKYCINKTEQQKVFGKSISIFFGENREYIDRWFTDIEK